MELDVVMGGMAWEMSESTRQDLQAGYWFLMRMQSTIHHELRGGLTAQFALRRKIEVPQHAGAHSVSLALTRVQRATRANPA